LIDLTEQGLVRGNKSEAETKIHRLYVSDFYCKLIDGDDFDDDDSGCAAQKERKTGSPINIVFAVLPLVGIVIP
jgi:hypothetical protein